MILNVCLKLEFEMIGELGLACDLCSINNKVVL